MTATRSVPIPDDVAITVVGERTVTLDADAIADLPVAETDHLFRCASGRPIQSEWVGVDAWSLLEAAAVPDDTTHLVVESADGYRVCIPVGPALDGVVAFTRDGTPIGDDNPYSSRFVAPGVDGPHAAKGVARIEALALGPHDDPESLENITEDIDGFSAT
ncbi:molybdopterin-dependent oxidoreductase [Halobacteriaceae archaeon GCM10025711]